MIVTEEEARSKRCQESFPAATGISMDGSMMHQVTSVQAFSGGSYSTTQNTGGAPYNCIGSRCMAWQFVEGRTTIDGAFLGKCGKVGG